MKMRFMGAGLILSVAAVLTAVVLTGGTGAIASDYSLTVSADPTAAVYNGGTCTITATVTIDGSPAEGHTILFLVSGLTYPGSVYPVVAYTNGDGKASTTYTSGTSGGTAMITARDFTPPAPAAGDLSCQGHKDHAYDRVLAHSLHQDDYRHWREGRFHHSGWCYSCMVSNRWRIYE